MRKCKLAGMLQSYFKPGVNFLFLADFIQLYRSRLKGKRFRRMGSGILEFTFFAS